MKLTVGGLIDGQQLSRADRNELLDFGRLHQLLLLELILLLLMLLRLISFVVQLRSPLVSDHDHGFWGGRLLASLLLESA